MIRDSSEARLYTKGRIGFALSSVRGQMTVGWAQM